MDIKEAREIWEQIDASEEMDMMDVFVNAQTTIIEYQQRQIENLKHERDESRDEAVDMAVRYKARFENYMAKYSGLYSKEVDKTEYNSAIAIINKYGADK